MAATENASLAQVVGWLQSMGSLAFDFTRALEKCLVAIISATKENFSGGHAPDGTPWKPLAHPRPSSKGADQPLRDKGLLAASITARGAPGNEELITPTRLEWGTNLDKAGLHQYGGTVRPTKAKALTIPLTKEAARAGSPKNMQNLFTIRGQRFLFEEKQKGRGKKSFTELIRHYIFVDQVTVPARPFLGWNDELAEECGQILADGAAKALVQSPVSSGGGPQMAA